MDIKEINAGLLTNCEVLEIMKHRVSGVQYGFSDRIILEKQVIETPKRRSPDFDLNCTGCQAFVEYVPTHILHEGGKTISVEHKENLR